MGTFNPIISWAELERRLSAREGDGPIQLLPGEEEAPGFSRHRPAYVPPARVARPAAAVPYAELHCHSNFSFLDGASPPEELVEEAVRLGLEALALTDHDGCYGIVRFAEAARSYGLPTLFGAELGLPLNGRGRPEARAGAIDPAASHLVVLARNADGYARLSRAIGRAQLAGGEKGRPRYEPEELGEDAAGEWIVLTGCRHGSVRRALEEVGPAGARRELERLISTFGREGVLVELFDHGDPLDSARNDVLAELAVRCGVEIVATQNAHYASPRRYPLATALAAIRARRSLDDADGYLPPWGAAALRSGAEQERRFRRYPGAVATTARIARECAFDLRLVAPRLPPFTSPTGESEAELLRRYTIEGAAERYGPPGSSRHVQAWPQIERELAIIEGLGFPGYFLVIRDIIEFCRREDIYFQGRGSAANSAVCYALRITNVDAVDLGLLFERFLSSAREGPPDIDVDIESGRRDEVIAYVYERYGREYTAQVANVITYRARSAVRDIGRALGYTAGSADAWSRQLGSIFSHHVPDPVEGDGAIPAEVLGLARELEDFPRHLGIHSGGMVICDRPIIDVCPVEWARRAGRTVLQWDKDDCAAVGFVKFDLLGLGMLEALHRMVDLLEGASGVVVDLASIPQEDEVYDMLSRADSMGVFQVESRAQMATLPRLRPAEFYDLVIEVALIRPGPIQGGSVHPYLRRKAGEEEVRYLHPLLRPALEKTLGVPLFQEQLMQIAIDVAGFSAADADELRQAMRREAVSGEDGEPPGPPLRRDGGERHRRQRRRCDLQPACGVRELRLPRIALGLVRLSRLCLGVVQAPPSRGLPRRAPQLPADGVLVPAEPHPRRPSPRGLGRLPAREPLGQRGHPRGRSLLGGGAGGPARDRRGPGPRRRPRRGGRRRRSVHEHRRRRPALGGAARPRRSSRDGGRVRWSPGRRRCRCRPPATGGTLGRRRAGGGGGASPRHRRRSECAAARADVGRRTDRRRPVGDRGDDRPSPLLSLFRSTLSAWGVLAASALLTREPGRVLVAGIVTHRQRPGTAGGTVFLNLEDETGTMNVICSRGFFLRYREAATSPAVVVRGRLERIAEAVTIVAEHIEHLELPIVTGRSRDFR